MIENKFRIRFGDDPQASSVTPGRVNLIGEHIDYNGGTVLPMALPISTHIALSESDGKEDEIFSENFDDLARLSMNSSPRNHWSDYASGALQKARAIGLLRGGAKLYVQSDVPDGAGLSSSAALVVGVLRAASKLAGVEIEDKDIALHAQAVENDFIGVPCGVMDQMAVAAAPLGSAIALDTRDLSFELVPAPTSHHIAVVHSGVMRKLDEGRYADRRRECERGAAHFGTSELAHLPVEQVRQIDQLPSPIDRRVRHVVREQARVDKAVNALRQDDIDAFGRILNEGHISLRDDFEVSTPEIDTLVDAAVKLGAVGARLTGGGFGGCIVACVPHDKLAVWRAALGASFPNARHIH